jgi:hypothetical protein
MHKIHSAKNLRCLVGILENTKCIECIFQILIFRAEVRIKKKKKKKKIKNLILTFDSHFC